MLIGYDYNYYFYSILISIFLLLLIAFFMLFYVVTYNNDIEDVINFDFYVDELVTSLFLSVFLSLISSLFLFSILLSSNDIVEIVYQETFPLTIDSVRKDNGYLVINDELYIENSNNINITDDKSCYKVLEGKTLFGFNYGLIELTLNSDDIDLLNSLLLIIN